MSTSDGLPSGGDDSRPDEQGSGGTPTRVAGRRVLAVCAGAGGLLAVGAVAAAGLAGSSTDPAAPTGADLRGSPEPAAAASVSEDPYRESLDVGVTPSPTPLPEGTSAPPLPEPTHRVEPPAPGGGYDEGVAGDVVAYEVPDLDEAWDAAVPDRLVPLGDDTAQYRLQPTVPGQSCDGPGPSAVAGRQWTWAEEDSDRLDQVSVDVGVTGWATGTGADALADVGSDVGACSWLGELPDAHPVDVPSAEGSWAADHRGAEQFADAAYGAARTGDLVVGVRVVGAPAAQAHPLVADVLEEAVSGLRAADPGGAAS